MFPETLPYRDYREIPEDEFYWIYTQTLIDDKFISCPACNHVQCQGDFCSECGESFSGEKYMAENYVCPDCSHYYKPDDKFCRFCSCNIGSDLYNKFQVEIDQRSINEDLADVGKDVAKRMMNLCEPIPDSWMEKLNQPDDLFMRDIYKSMESNKEIQKQMQEEMQKLKEQ